MSVVRNKWFILGSLALVGLVGSTAFAGGFGRWHHGADSEEEIREHLGYVAKRALGRVDATDAQRQAVDAVLDEVAPKVFAHKKAQAELRDQALAALEKPQVDREELARLRARIVEMHNGGSEEILDVIVKVSDILNVEQRQELVSAVREHFCD